MVTPRHAGSKVVPHAPNLVRAFRKLQSDVRRMQTRTRPESLYFTKVDWTQGVDCSSATMANTWETLVYRSGQTMYVDVLAATGASSTVAAQLNVPDIPVTGAAVQSQVGGNERIISIRLDFPDAWTMGDAHRVFVQARRSSGSETVTVRILRGIQR